MKYHCGHSGCDICGSRECANAKLKFICEYVICDHCLIKVVKLGVQISETFGGSIIDPTKPCFQLPKG